MVHAYFHDKLKKIISDKGPGIICYLSKITLIFFSLANNCFFFSSNISGLYDKIMMYKETEKLTDEDFPFHKIFIIICASGLIPTSLENIDNIRIKSRKVYYLYLLVTFSFFF